MTELTGKNEWGGILGSLLLLQGKKQIGGKIVKRLSYVIQVKQKCTVR